MGLIKVLSILLILQVGIVAFVSTGGKGMSVYTTEELLFTFKPADLKSVHIHDSEGASIRFVQNNGSWKMPDYFSIPVNEKKLNAFTGKLISAGLSWPVTRSMLAANQLKVGEADFERKIIFNLNDGTEHTLYVGTSNSFKKVHVRRGDSKDTYELEFSTHEASISKNQWVDRFLLKTPREDVEKIVIGEVELEKQGNQFALKGLIEGEVQNLDEVKSIVDNAIAPKFEEVYGIESEEKYNQSSPEFTFMLYKKDGTEVKGIYSKMDDDNFVLKMSDKPYYVKVFKYYMEKLSKLERENLINKK